MTGSDIPYMPQATIHLTLSASPAALRLRPAQSWQTWWQSLWSLALTGQSLVALRVLGGVVGLGLIIWAFQQFRRHDIRRVEFLLIVTVGVSLVVVAANPAVVTVLAQMLALQDRQFGRLIALLVLSQMALWLLLLGRRTSEARQARQFDLLVRRLAQQTFASEERQGALNGTVAVLIPALNEADNLRVVLPRMPSSVLGVRVATLVINDGSVDDTVAVARAAGALVARNPINRGGGAAIRLGFDLALANQARVIVTMDADGQHLPEELERLVTPVLNDELDFVIGSRVSGSRERDSLVRLAGIHVFSAVINLLTGLRITDSSSGYRALSRTAVEKLLLTQDQFHTAEALIDGSKRGLRIGEVPVTIRRRYSGMSKKGRNLSYGANYSRSVVNSWLRD